MVHCMILMQSDIELKIIQKANIEIFFFYVAIGGFPILFAGLIHPGSPIEVGGSPPYET